VSGETTQRSSVSSARCRARSSAGSGRKWRKKQWEDGCRLFADLLRRTWWLSKGDRATQLFSASVRENGGYFDVVANCDPDSARVSKLTEYETNEWISEARDVLRPWC